MRPAVLMVEGDLPGLHLTGLLSMVEVWLAEGFIDRLFGVFATAGDRPILLRNCRRIHGFGLRRPLFLTFLDGQGVVIREGIVLKPWWIAADLRADHVLESFVPLALPIGCRLILKPPQAGSEG